MIMTVQDDSEFHPDSREIAESTPWPSARAAFLSLYTPTNYSHNIDGTLKPAGVIRVRAKSLWGAVAMIWKRETLKAVINHPVAKHWNGARTRHVSSSLAAKREANPSIVANSDTAIGQILRATKMESWYVNPSPVRHIAVHSTIAGHGDNKGRRNCGPCAEHGRPLAEQINPVSRTTFSHVIVVRSSYDDLRLSRRRLDITARTLVRSLVSQKNKAATLIVRTNPKDPLLTERLEAFRSTGIPLSDEAPSGPCIFTRVDDDDLVAPDFLEIIQSHATELNQYIGIPNGWISDETGTYESTIRDNMFGSVTTDDPQFDIFSVAHRDLPRGRRRITVDRRLWTWNRHADTQSTALKRYYGRRVSTTNQGPS